MVSAFLFLLPLVPYGAFRSGETVPPPLFPVHLRDVPVVLHEKRNVLRRRRALRVQIDLAAAGQSHQKRREILA